jgi:hypothetical protein
MWIIDFECVMAFARCVCVRSIGRTDMPSWAILVCRVRAGQNGG